MPTRALAPATPAPLDLPDGGAIAAYTTAEIDRQVATAKAYPRDVRRALDQACTMATLDQDTAAACVYAVPRAGGATITGPSVRLAEIVASAWGNMRIEGRIVEVADRHLTARGMALDLESNLAVAIEVRRRIVDRHNRRYSDDMIAQTANAAISIARRNAIFGVVPQAYTAQVMAAAKRFGTGQPPQQAPAVQPPTLRGRVDRALGWLIEHGADAGRVFAYLGVQDAEAITADHLEVLQSVRTAITDGELTADAAFPDPAQPRPPAVLTPDPMPAPPPEQAGPPSTPPAAAGSPSTTPAAPPDPPALISDADRRRLLATAAKAGRDAPAVLAHLRTAYGVSTVRDLPAEHLPEAMDWAAGRAD